MFIHMEATTERVKAPTNPITRIVADRVAAEITRQGRYKVEVAKAADISQASFSRKINAQQDFTLPELVRIAAALDVSWAEFLPEPS